MLCILQRKHSGVRCYLASTWCKYDLRNGDFCSELGMGAMSEARK